MKLIVIAAIAAAGMAVAGAANAQEALAKSSGCLICHDVSAKKVGPAFKDIAAKNKGKADAQAKLVAKVSGAKDHPKVNVPEGDVKSVVKWALSL